MGTIFIRIWQSGLITYLRTLWLVFKKNNRVQPSQKCPPNQCFSTCMICYGSMSIRLRWEWESIIQVCATFGDYLDIFVQCTHSYTRLGEMRLVCSSHINNHSDRLTKLCNYVLGSRYRGVWERVCLRRPPLQLFRHFRTTAAWRRRSRLVPLARIVEAKNVENLTIPTN